MEDLPNSKPGRFFLSEPMFMDITAVLPLLKSVISPAVEVASGDLIKERLDYWVWDIHTRTPNLRLVVKLAGPRAV